MRGAVLRVRIAVSVVCAVGVLASMGCSATGAASMGAGMGMNLARKDSHLKVWLDGVPAKQDKLKKAARGYSRFEVGDPVSTSPRLKFEIESPDKFGRIMMVSAQIHQKFEADYSHNAEFILTARDVNNPQAQMKPGVEYNLGAPGGDLKVYDVYSKEVSGVTLQPGMKYMLVLTVKADKSESAQIYFETR